MTTQTNCCEHCNAQDGAFCAYSKCPCHTKETDGIEAIVEEFLTNVPCIQYGGVPHTDNAIAREELRRILTTYQHRIEEARAEGAREYKQFVMNVLDGVDVADAQMQNKGGGTQAIRLALASRIITPKEPNDTQV